MKTELLELGMNAVDELRWRAAIQRNWRRTAQPILDKLLASGEEPHSDILEPHATPMGLRLPPKQHVLAVFR